MQQASIVAPTPFSQLPTPTMKGGRISITILTIPEEEY